MADSLPALVFGGLLLLLGGGSAWYLRRQPLPPVSEPDAREFALHQRRRRYQVSGLLALIGVLIPLGDTLPLFRQSPVAFVIFWVAILFLAGWVMLLAVADFATSRLHHGRAQQRLDQQRQRLEAELTRLKQARGGSRIHSDE